MKTNVACFYKTGTPEEVIQLESWDLTTLNPTEVSVEMLYAPINPADINILQGRYNHQPHLPAVGGSEGVGLVLKTGTEVERVKVGDMVIAPRSRGRWCTNYIINEQELFRLPPGIPPEQAAMLIVNAATAYQLLTSFWGFTSHSHDPDRQIGRWIVQNAANSGVGRNVFRLAKHYGIKCINIVRRQELKSILEKEGAEFVVSEEESLRDYAPPQELLLGLNCVGGASALRLARSLSEGGVMVTYGAMAKEPLTVENKLLIFKNLVFTGFSMRNWYQKASLVQIHNLMDQVSLLMQKGVFQTPIEEIYPLTKVKQALVHAQQENRGGKILLKLN